MLIFNESPEAGTKINYFEISLRGLFARSNLILVYNLV
ncbi:MAG: hypothetical protein JWP12_3903 [Bacteroidetes bacterium]|nr:hypothetical protein [Bacteroidota bacterium]